MFSVGGINEFREFPEIKLIANFPNLIADLRICVVNLLPGVRRKAFADLAVRCYVLYLVASYCYAFREGSARLQA